MATRTSVGSGLWSAVGTWDAGIPVDGDDVVIASGHTVVFDVDQSGFTTGVKVTITGTLTHTTASGTYCLFAKTGASIVGAGTWNIGTSGAPIPFASKHTITGAAGWYVDGVSGLTMTVYGAEPSIKYVKLSAAEAAGQTELSVDTDVTGDIWAAGDIIRIDNINKGQDSEERIIAAGGITASTITITQGLTGAKLAGSYVCLITRNVKIIAVGTGTQTIYRVTNLAIQSGMWVGVNKYMLSSCNYAVISGGTFSGNNNGLYNCSSATISGGTFSGNSQGLNTCNYAVISGGTFSGNSYGLNTCASATISGGTFSGNNYGLINCASATISGGTFSGNNCGLRTCASATISGGTFNTNAFDLYASFGRLFNVTLGSATEHGSYTSMAAICQNCQSDNHDGVAGALKAWCNGGVVTSQNTVVPTGYTQAYLLDPESADYPVFFTKTFTVSAGEIVEVEVWLRKDASMDYLPRVYLVKSIENPLAGAIPTNTFTMTDSINAWESVYFVVNNSAGTFENEYCLYFAAKNATDNVYAAYKITPRSSGGGAVSIR